MGDFKKNPKRPFDVGVPESTKRKMKGSVRYKRENRKTEKVVLKKAKQLLKPLVALVPKRGSMWSRFTNWVKRNS